MNTFDQQKVIDAYHKVRESKRSGMKDRIDIKLSNGTAVIYSMGDNNPVIRIDIKEKEEDNDNVSSS